ncbi:MAG: hypothetical protein LBG43_10050 [Treponema sp.]|nr:hypothetical protein [Treponema sp.]
MGIQRIVKHGQSCRRTNPFQGRGLRTSVANRILARRDKRRRGELSANDCKATTPMFCIDP